MSTIEADLPINKSFTAPPSKIDGNVQESSPPHRAIIGSGNCGCSECTGSRENPMSENPFIYAIGKIHPRFPDRSIEKEYAQLIGRSTDSGGLTDFQALKTALSKRENRYIARNLCWLFTIRGVETYILRPRDPIDYEVLIDSLVESPRQIQTDVDVVIGERGPIATREICNGLLVPVVRFDQIYSFPVESLLNSIPKPERVPAKEFRSTSEELFHGIVQMTDNAGSTDEHRALNYLAVRYPAIYSQAANQYKNNSSLSAVEVKPSSISGVRKMVDVVFSYTNRNTDVTEKFFVRVDVGKFPYLVTKLSPYYDLH
jgi:hypothetical protein